MEDFPLIIRILIYVFAFFTGASIFSFLEVMTVRIPQKKPFVTGSSVCDSCGHELSAFDMIPVFGWLLLGGRCRYCKTKFPPTSSIKEFFGGALAVFCLLKFGNPAQAVCVFAFVCALEPAAFIDAKTMEIPDGFPIAAAIVGIASAFFFKDISWIDRIIGAVCVSVPMLLLAFTVKDGFGFGDVKLIAACGIFLGWRLSVFSFCCAAVAAGIYGVYLLISRKLSRGGHFPFGPFLCAGAAACAAFQSEITGFLYRLFDFL